MPSHLDATGQAEWKEVCDILEGMGVLSTAFARSLELYCESYSNYRRAIAMVDKVGIAIVTRDKNGETHVRRNQFSVEAHKYKDECYRFLSEFGLTPSSKSRIVVTKNEPRGLSVRERA